MTRFPLCTTHTPTRISINDNLGLISESQNSPRTIQFAVVRHERDNLFVLNDHFDTNPDYIPDSERSIKSDSYRPVFQYTYHFILSTQHTYLHRQRSVLLPASRAHIGQSLTWTRV